MSKDNTIFIGKNKSFKERNRRSGGYLMKRRIKEISISVIRALLMFGLCFMIISPMISRLSMSLMEEIPRSYCCPGILRWITLRQWHGQHPCPHPCSIPYGFLS